MSPEPLHFNSGRDNPSNPPHVNELVLSPAAGAVGLQRDRPGGRDLEPVVLEYRVAVDADKARRVLHPKLEQPPLLGLDPGYSPRSRA